MSRNFEKLINCILAIVVISVFAWVGSARGQFGSSNKLIESPNEIELKPANRVEVVGDLLIEDQNQLQLEDNGASNYTVNLQAPSGLAASYSLLLPGADGSNGDVLTTDGSGNLSFSTIQDNLSILTLEEQGSTPSTPSSGFKKIYCKTDDNCYQLSDAGQETELGAGGAGDIYNLIEDPKFDDQTDPFTHGSGTGAAVGSGGYLETTTTASPYINLTTATAHEHTWCFTPNGSTGNYNIQYEVGCHVKSAASDVTIAFNDGTNDDSVSATYGGSDKWEYIYTRGTPASGEQVCLVLDSATTENIGVDTCHIGKPKFNTAELSNETELETCSTTGSLSTNVTLSCKMKRKGDRGYFEFVYDFSGTNTEGTVEIDLPNGLTFDTSKFEAEAFVTKLGDAKLLDAGTSAYVAEVVYVDSNTVRVRHLVDISTFEGAGSTDTSTGTPFTIASGDKFIIVVDSDNAFISGWSEKSTNVITPTTSTAPSSGGSTTAGTLASSTTYYVDLDTENFDDDSNFTGCGSGHVTTSGTGCRWVAPRKGKIFAAGAIRWADTTAWTGGEQAYVTIVKNGSSVKDKIYENPTISNTTNHIVNEQVSGLIDVEKGDEIELSVYQTSASTLSIINNVIYNYLDIFYVDQGANWAGAEIVTTPGTGGGAQLVSVNVDCDSGSTLSNEVGQAFASITNIASGGCTITYTSSYWQSEPNCWTSGGSSQDVYEAVASTDSTQIRLACLNDGGGNCTDFDVRLACHGIAN